MASIRKKAKIGGHQLTQFSDLPDEILICILSLLPTKDAVRTCLLVLRQQHLWKSLTSLEFHEEFSIRRSRFSQKKRSRFMNFVDRVMDLRDHSVPLDSFSLQDDLEEKEEEEDANRIKTWITKAVQCNVEELTLSIQNSSKMKDDPFRFQSRVDLVSCIFRCQSLVKLVLESITVNNVPSSDICLPCLKYLTLRRAKFYDDKSLERLFSSPLLEELIIEECHWGTVPIRSINVRSPKLQVLKITDCPSQSTFCASKICIIGDNLKYFSYMGGLMNEYRISSSTQLSKVEIYVKQLSELERYISKIRHRDTSPNCYNILEGLSGTRNLALSDYLLERLQKYKLLDTIPIFEDLTCLDIQVYKEVICIDSLPLMKIYKRCPRLECLNIGKLSRRPLRSPRLRPIPLCFQTHLKKVLVHYPGVEANAAIDMLLNSALVLEELVINCKRDKEKGFHEGGHKIQELQDRLNRRPRVSKDCTISVRVI